VARVYKTFPVNDIILLKQQVLSWCSRFNICCFFDNHEYQSNLHSYECLAAAGAVNIFEPSDDFFASLSAFDSSVDDWIFGHFNYDVKNLIDSKLTSLHPDALQFPDCLLFIPQVVIKLSEQFLEIGGVDDNTDLVYKEILDEKIVDEVIQPVELQPRVTQAEYIAIINKLLAHLKRGDCYEINYCQEFFANAIIAPLAVYKRLNIISPNPFSAFYRVNDKYLLSASPERYIKKTGNSIISQPIKGTAPRSLANSKQDNYNKEALQNSAKERSENVMVVDLVRNDLSKICVEGTVKVDELFGIYSFPNVHQMISTITGELKSGVEFSDVLKATFPMGSMTGAPKKRVMELIEKYEVIKRGIYSGALGYISPQRDFDFSVVIRSIMYNEAINYLSYQVGGGITYYSQPEKEYDECLLKAKAINAVFAETKKDKEI
jgi:para-aminobenzoate synthetase component I